MRRLPIVAGLALSIVAAGTTFAATPHTTPATPIKHLVPVAAQVWTAMVTGTTAKGAATLVVNAKRTAGHAHVNVRGLTAATKADAVIFERNSKGVVTVLSSDKALVLAKAGTFDVSWAISRATVTKIEAGLKLKDKLYVEIVDGKTALRSTFVLKV